MPDVITGSTQLSPTFQTVIATAAQKELLANSQLAPTVTDVSQFAVKGNDKIRFPKLGAFTVENRASATAGEIQTLASSNDELTLDIKAYVSWLIDANDEMQSRLDVKMEYAMRAASAHGRYIDSRIRAAVIGAEGFVASSVGLYNRIVDARAFLVRNQANLNDVFLVASPEMEAELLKVENFSKADVFGQAVIPSGVIGRVLGMPILISNTFAADEIYVWDKSAVALGFQKAPNYASQPEIAYGTTAVREAMDLLAGVKALQINQGAGTLLGGSGLIAKVQGAA